MMVVKNEDCVSREKHLRYFVGKAKDILKNIDIGDERKKDRNNLGSGNQREAMAFTKNEKEHMAASFQEWGGHELFLFRLNKRCL